VEEKSGAKKRKHKVLGEVPQHPTPYSILKHPCNWPLLKKWSWASLACSLTQPHCSLLWEAKRSEQIKNSPEKQHQFLRLLSLIPSSSGRRQRQFWELLFCEFSAVFFLPWDSWFPFHNVSQILCVRISLK